MEGLRIQHEYKITVVAIGTIGESSHSNAAIIYVPGVEIADRSVGHQPQSQEKRTYTP